MTPDISCRSLIQIGLQIPRGRTKCRQCKDMAVSQAFIFHCKCYSILHFAVQQLLGWAFLIDDEPRYDSYVGTEDSHRLSVWFHTEQFTSVKEFLGVVLPSRVPRCSPIRDFVASAERCRYVSVQVFDSPCWNYSYKWRVLANRFCRS